MQVILVLNIGSSTIKFATFAVSDGKLQRVHAGVVDKILDAPLLKIKDAKAHVLFEEKIKLTGLSLVDPYEAVLNEILHWLQVNNIEIIAAGHRVIHGALKYREPVIVDEEKMHFFASLSHLAPLHQPYNLKGISILQKHYPQIMQVACFDTSFHTTCNELSQLFSIPQWLIKDGVRRYGFHGLSYEYITTQLDKYLSPEKANGRVIVAHLGQGASMCAIKNKKSVATTLSFTALDGLPMGTRCGNIDPGVLLHFMSYYKMDYKQIEKILYKESGLLGLSGVSSDMRELLISTNPDAKLAVDVFVYKIGGWIGMLAAELQGLDAIIFTAGIGENAPYIREKICERAAWLGAKFDAERNAKNAETISARDSKVAIHVIHTDEELMIANHTYRLYQRG